MSDPHQPPPGYPSAHRPDRFGTSGEPSPWDDPGRPPSWDRPGHASPVVPGQRAYRPEPARHLPPDPAGHSVFTSPSHPSSHDQPSQSPWAQPGASAYAQPDRSIYPQPDQATYPQPGQSAYAQPSRSPYAQPGRTDQAQPGQSGYGQPGPSAYAQPGSSAYAPPAPSAYAQPSYAPPGPSPYGQPSYPQPGQPPYAQPAAPQGPPGYGPPGYPGEQAGPPNQYGFVVPQQRYPAGYAPPYQPWPAPPVVARPSSPARMVLLIAIPVVLVVSLLGVALALRAGRDDSKPPVAATALPTIPTAEPTTSGEREAAEAAATAAIDGVLTTQATALLAGDQAAYTSVADPAATTVRSWLTDRYASLHAMGIAKWDTRVASVDRSTSLKWEATVTVDYCFVATCGRPMSVRLNTTWNTADPAAPKLTRISDRTPGQPSPPWAQSVLQAKVGSRVVVAASSANAGKLPAMLRRAESAAENADKYATSAPPGKYLVYLASAKEWTKWPNYDMGEYVIGYAHEKSESLVINMPEVESAELDTVLRHELVHVSSLAGESRNVRSADSWWLGEGLAEYGASSTDYAEYLRRPETTWFVTSKWNGDLRVGAPTRTSSAKDGSGRYGTAYLGVSCLMLKYGRSRTLGFFRAVAVEGDRLTEAADKELGTAWTAVQKTCTAWIRQTVKQ